MKILIFNLFWFSLILLTSCFGNEQENSIVSSATKKNDSVTSFNKGNSGNISNEDDWGVDKIEGKTIQFKNERKVETNLFELKYIGQLKTKNKAPYLILSGKTCDNCDENISIYIYSPSDGIMKNAIKQSRYSYPGKEEDYSTNELIYESRMFYGNCLGSENCIWVQKNLNNKKIWEKSIFIVRIENDTLQEIQFTNDHQLNELLPEIMKCPELPGMDITSEP